MTPPAAQAGYAYLEGTLTTSYDSQAAYTTIDRVRSAVHAVPGANAEVGGTTAISLDVKRRPRTTGTLSSRSSWSWCSSPSGCCGRWWRP